MSAKRLSSRLALSRSPMLDKKSIRAVLLIISTFTYLLLGAAVFEKLEARAAAERREELSVIADKMQRKYNFTKK
ncbi:hypothetical protein AB6A40_002971 [Gnathostoma spinigerum]|uniref:Uncharacterized protein n=1 Tax=Gnathostoma spinigerum TaxID=75299 RepID=A0ABD6EHV5_9BILA